MIDHAGQLDRRIEFQNQSTSVDDYGQNVGGFSTAFSRWAKVEEKSGTEGEEGNQMVATKRVHFFIRYDSAIQETWRIVYNSKTYTIDAILNADARESFMKIVTTLKD
jgi:SPP1 family predicted phage head-tail adaptor